MPGTLISLIQGRFLTTLILLLQPCCTTIFWLAVIHTVDLSSPGMLAAVELLTPQPLCLYTLGCGTSPHNSILPTKLPKFCL